MFTNGIGAFQGFAFHNKPQPSPGVHDGRLTSGSSFGSQTVRTDRRRMRTFASGCSSCASYSCGFGFGARTNGYQFGRRFIRRLNGRQFRLKGQVGNGTGGKTSCQSDLLITHQSGQSRFVRMQHRVRVRVGSSQCATFCFGVQSWLSLSLNSTKRLRRSKILMQNDYKRRFTWLFPCSERNGSFQIFAAATRPSSAVVAWMAPLFRFGHFLYDGVQVIVVQFLGWSVLFKDFKRDHFVSVFDAATAAGTVTAILFQKQSGDNLSFPLL